MSTQNEAIARAWLDAFNAHDVARLVALYADDCVHLSPKLRAQRPETGGRVVGKAALSSWWAEALQRLPGLRYQATSITANADRVFLEYLRHVPGEPALAVAEVFEVRGGRISTSRVYHG